jgi:N-acetylneuraminic acid mutarotase
MLFFLSSFQSKYFSRIFSVCDFMKLICLLFTGILSFVSWSQNWSQLANFSGDSRDDASVFTIGNQIYCGLGMNAGFACTSDFHVFNLSTETWTFGLAMPSSQARQYANAFAYAGKGYIFGGVNGNATYLSDLWKFDPLNETWSPLPVRPTAGVSGAMSFVLQDTVYIVGGKLADGTFTSEVWGFDLVQENWFQRASIPSDGIWRGVSFSRNNQGIIGGGKLNSGTLNPDFYTYDPQSNLWETWNTINFQPSIYAMYAQIDSVGFVYGGVLADNSYSNNFIKINLDTREVINLSSFPALARKGGVGFVGENSFYISTGVTNSGRTNETWKAATILGIKPLDAEIGLRLVPNPTQNMLQIQANELIQQVEIATINGTKVSDYTINNSDCILPIQLPSGFYFVKIYGSDWMRVEKIVVER